MIISNASKFGLFVDKKIDIMKHLRLASMLHDIGKVSIPDHILNKNGKLTDEEFESMKEHTTIGYELLRKSGTPVMQMTAIIAYEHHERYDGTGYPLGLKGGDIQQISQIVSLCDVFDALCSKRVCKDPWNLDDVIDYLKAHSGKQFDPVVLEALFKNLGEIKLIKNTYQDDPH